MSETQRDIKALEWRPNSGKTISVASKGGICIWSASYPGNAASVRSGVTSSLGTVSRSSGVRWAMIDFLRSPNGEQISALSFSLTFLHILGICFLSELIIHNMGYCSRERNSYSTWIRRHINAEVVTIWRLLFDCKIRWNILSVGDKYMDLRAVVFNRWMCYWSNLGSRRTYGTSWILKVYDIRFNPLLIKVSFIRCTSTTGGAARNCCFDGQPWDRKIAWDASGERLALSYKGGDELYSGLIAVYDIRRAPLVSSSLVGFIRGPGEKPTPLAFGFNNKFKQGPLLSVCWSSGFCCTYPLIFRSHVLP
ncbi:aladin isoform X2 [Iris pallida]|uniref:Aladin isoform X2 n=1 Tax=Iris pallida TaxID=29817 RepID=A0AAX6EPB6_IRIPA|nr:aladin isoform X2 [Iris pallida]